MCSSDLGQVQYVFVELPKYPRDRAPTNVVEEWAYVLRTAGSLRAVPALLPAPETRRALEAAGTAAFDEADGDACDRARIAAQDSRGALGLARKEGRAEGAADGARRRPAAAMTAGSAFRAPEGGAERAVGGPATPSRSHLQGHGEAPSAHWGCESPSPGRGDGAGGPSDPSGRREIRRKGSSG